MLYEQGRLAFESGAAPPDSDGMTIAPDYVRGWWDAHDEAQYCTDCPGCQHYAVDSHDWSAEDWSEMKRRCLSDAFNRKVQ